MIMNISRRPAVRSRSGLLRGVFGLFLVVLVVGGVRPAWSGEEPSKEAMEFRKALPSKDLAQYSEAARALRRWAMAHDPQFPIYHFTPPEGRINDPNGPIYFQGRYHLFYQFQQQIDNGKGGTTRTPKCWGHAVSKDLVHWEDWPVVLWPDTPEDRGGVYSGNTFVDDEGNLAALYTGNTAGNKAPRYGILARSLDGGLTWTKKVVMDHSQRPNPDSPVHHDGQTWKHGDTWYQLIGGSTGGPKAQGAAWLWRSPDLINWKLVRNIAPSIKLRNFWELPYLVSFGDRDVLFVGAKNSYWAGKFDYETGHFEPDSLEARRIDPGNYYSFNFNMTDDRGPGGAKRQLMHGWVLNRPTSTPGIPYWQGAHTIPRVVSLRPDGKVWQEPIPEIESLRGQHWHFDAEKEAVEGLETIKEDAAEIIATFLPTGEAGTFGVKLRISDDGAEYVRVYVDLKSKTFGIDGPIFDKSNEGVEPHARKPVIYLETPSESLDLVSPKDPITLRIFLDRSVLEVYVNGNALTVCPESRASAKGIEIFNDGGAALKEFDLWRMNSAW